MFVGRERELAELRAGLDGAIAGRGRLFLVSGEPGIGKTRLTDELCAAARALGALVLWGRCWEGGGAPAYWPWLQLIRGYARTVGGGTLARTKGWMRSHLAQLLPELVGQEERAGDAESPGQEGEQSRFALFSAITSFWRNAAKATALVLVLDDLHVADRPSLVLLRFAARELRDVPVLLIGTYRDGEVRTEHDRARVIAEIGREATSLPLRGLSEAETGELVEATARRPIVPASVAALHRATGGNPFFLDELVRLLMAEGRLDRPELPRGVGVPDLVRWAITRRLEQLPAGSMEVLRQAAVIGQAFDMRLLERVAAIPGDRLLALLDPAVVLGVVAAEAGRGRFTHALVRETLYGDLDASRRVELHRVIGEALEVEHAGDPESGLRALADHFLAAAAGGDSERAIEYARRAGERALELLAYEDAAGFFERALPLLPPNGADDRRRWSLLLGLAAATNRAGDGEAATRALQSAAVEARRLASPELLARTALAFPQGVTAGSVDTERVALLEDALAGLGEHDDPLRARVMARLAWELFWSDNSPTRCESLAAEAIAMARRTADVSTLAYTLNARRYATWGAGTIEERLVIATELQVLARRTGDSELVMEAHHWRVIDLLELGDVGAADREIEAHGRLASEVRQPLYLWWSAMWRATRATMSGRFAEAEQLASRAFDVGDRVQRANAGTTFQTQLMLLRRERGQLEEVAKGMVEWTTAHGHLALGTSFRCGLAQVFSELGRESEARVVFEQLAAERFGGRHPTDLCSDMACLAEASAFLDDSARAAMVYERLLPYAGRNIVIGPAIGCFGPVDRFLGLLAATTRRYDEAAAHFDAALDLAIGMAAPPFVARIQHDYAAMLAVRGRPEDLTKARGLIGEALATARRLDMARVAERAETLAQRMGIPTSAGTSSGTTSFRREGDYWTIIFGAATVRMRDSDGLRYLAQLLASPGRSFHVLELVALGHRQHGEGVPSGAAFAEAALAQARLRVIRLGDAGTVLDEQARAAYQRRLADLEVEIDQANAANDIGRAERLRTEFEALVGELSSALGLHGRSRRTADVAERARVAVAKALHRVLARIRASHHPLGHHLARTVRTGMFCVYSPDPRVQIAWDVSLEI